MLDENDHLRNGTLSGQPFDDLVRAEPAQGPHPEARPGGEAPSRPRLIIRGQDELLEAARQQADWIVEGVVARKQVALVAGSPKDGKSTWLIGMMAAVSHGRPSFAGFRLSGRPAGILYLHEDPAGTVGRRILQAGVGANFGAVGHRENLPRLAAEFAPKYLADSIAEAAGTCGAGLIIVDTLRRWLRLDERDELQADDGISRLQEMAERENLAVVVVHHTRKPGVGQGAHRGATIDDVRGSGALTGAPDNIVLVRRKPVGSSFVDLHGWGREPEHEFHRRLHYDVQGGAYEVVEGQVVHREAATAEALVAAVAEVYRKTRKPVSRNAALKQAREGGASMPNDLPTPLLARLVDEGRLNIAGGSYLPADVDGPGGHE